MEMSVVSSLKEETCPLKSPFSSPPRPGAQKPAPPSQPGPRAPLFLRFLPFSVGGCDAPGLSSHLALPESSHFAVSFGVCHLPPPARTSETFWAMPEGDPGGLAPGARCRAWNGAVGSRLASVREEVRGVAGAFHPLCFVSGHPRCRGTKLLLSVKLFRSLVWFSSLAGTRQRGTFLTPRWSERVCPAPGEEVRSTALGSAS